MYFLTSPRGGPRPGKARCVLGPVSGRGTASRKGPMRARSIEIGDRENAALLQDCNFFVTLPFVYGGAGNRFSKPLLWESYTTNSARITASRKACIPASTAGHVRRSVQRRSSINTIRGRSWIRSSAGTTRRSKPS